MLPGVPEPGRGRAGHVVQLGPLPVLGVRVAGRGQRGPQGLLPHHAAGDGHGHPLLLGGQDGEPNEPASAERRRGILRVSLPGGREQV